MNMKNRHEMNCKKNRAKKIPLSSGIDESSSSDIFEWNQLIHRQAHQMTFDEPQFSMTQKVNVVVTDGNGQIDRQSTNNNSILSSRIIIIFFFNLLHSKQIICFIRNLWFCAKKFTGSRKQTINKHIVLWNCSIIFTIISMQKPSNRIKRQTEPSIEREFLFLHVFKTV